jgi:hypothetical protein
VFLPPRFGQPFANVFFSRGLSQPISASNFVEAVAIAAIEARGTGRLAQI